MTTRESTPEGMLRTGAVLTRAGPISYTKGELGMDGDAGEVVTVHRTMASLQDPKTIASIRGAPVTVGHPPGGVTPDNYSDVVKGAVAGEPKIESNTIVGNLLIGDKEALADLDAGVRELSIGYDFVLDPNGDTIGPIRVNHVALVERGRSGSAVRVLDSLDQSEEDFEMSLTKDDLTGAMADALGKAMEKTGKDGPTVSDMSKVMHDAMKPFMDGMKEMKDAQDEAQRKEREAEAIKKAEDAATKLTDSVRADERTRFAVLTDAMPFIAEDKRAALMDADPKTILAAAVGDMVPDAATQSVDYLRGVLNARKVAGAAAAPTQDQLPAGVLPFTPATATDKRTSVLDEYKDAQAKAYAEAGGQ